jgi:hypothetical protein
MSASGHEHTLRSTHCQPNSIGMSVIFKEVASIRMHHHQANRNSLVIHTQSLPPLVYSQMCDLTSQ